MEKDMPDFTAHRHPALAVPCPDCHRAPGLWCRTPHGQMRNHLHRARQAEADRQFIEAHGPDAIIFHDGAGWSINPRGRAGMRMQRESAAARFTALSMPNIKQS
jgi:hypothetical protein